MKKAKILITILLLTIFISPINVSASGYELVFEATIYNWARDGQSTTIHQNPYNMPWIEYDNGVGYHIKRSNQEPINVKALVTRSTGQTVAFEREGSTSLTYGLQPGSSDFGTDITVAFYFANYTPSSSIPPPDDSGSSTIDYSTSLTTIINRLNTLISRSETTNTRLNTLNNSITSMNNSINSRLDTTNSRLNTVNNSINSMRTDINSRLDTTNSHLNNIRNNLNTNKSAERNQPPDWSNNLSNNVPDQPSQSFTDTNTYFEESTVNEVSADMPEVPEVKQWDGVDEPENMQQENELSKDNELSTDTELSIDIELSTDDFIQDNQLSIDNELSKDNFIQDNQLSTDTQLSKDNFNQDNELSKDNYDLTEQYDQTNQFEQSEFYNQETDDYNLRWRSTNGKFH